LFVLLGVGVHSHAQANDTLFFNLARADRVTHLWFSNSGIMSSSFTCNVCPGDEAMGFYEKRNDTLLLSYKLRFFNESRPNEKPDTTIDFIYWKDTMYLVEHAGVKYVCSDKNFFYYQVKRYQHTGDESELNQYFFRQAGRRE